MPIEVFTVHQQYTDYTKNKHVIAIKPNGYCHFHFCFITSTTGPNVKMHQKSARLHSKDRLKWKFSQISDD